MSFNASAHAPRSIMAVATQASLHPFASTDASDNHPTSSQRWVFSLWPSTVYVQPSGLPPERLEQLAKAILREDAEHRWGSEAWQCRSHDLLQGGLSHAVGLDDMLTVDPNTYDPETALFPADVIAFVQKTQPKIWTRLTQLDAAKAPAMLLDSLVKELAAKGALAILREGFKCVGKTVRLAYFAPNTGLDAASTERYDDNRLTIVRQVNTKSGAIPDVVLAVNGLPVATLELKNPMSATRWNVENAKYQYRFERDPKELLFAFKQRCLVHFAVDTELVFMTTKLEGKDTFFLPHSHPT